MANQTACANCGKLSTPLTTKPRLFCSGKCRAAAWRNSLSARSCAYCGVGCSSIDHFPPQEMRADLIDLQHRFPFREVDSCQECALLLRGRVLWTLSKRRRFIRRVLKLRYRRILEMPNWSDRQLAQMSSSMLDTIQGRMNMKQWTQRRVKAR